jgi:Domain of unknown function (DUF1735)/Domain of unknown function (DUF4361)
MNKIKKSGLILFGLLFGLISCTGDSTDPNVAEVVSITGNVGGTLQNATFKIDTLVEAKYKVIYESANSLSKDLPITIGVTQAALDLLKTTNAKRATTGDDAYEALPVSVYTFVNPVIKAGQKEAEFSVKVKLPKSLDYTKEYVIPLGILNANGVKISDNLGFMNIFVDGTPNKYQGIYRSIGTFSHPTTPRKIDREKTLTSIDKFTSETEFADLSYPMWLKVNKDNTITIIPKGDAANVAGPFEQTGINKYDPITKTFTLNYQYNSGTRGISEKITKQ